MARTAIKKPGKFGTLLDKEDMAEIRAGKGRPSAAEEKREAKKPRPAKSSKGPY